jgi:hypothetical protein
VHSRDKTADVMAKHLTECLVDLCGFGLTAERVTELRLYHHKGGFDVRPLVIALHKSLLIVREVVKHSTPQRGMALVIRAAIHLKGNVRQGRVIHDSFKIIIRQISFICAHFIHHEALRRPFDQLLEVRTIASIAVCDFNSRDHVRFHAADKMYLYPILFIYQVRLGIFGVHPLNKAASGKAGRVNGKVSFNRSERQAGLFNEHLQIRREGFHLEIVKDGVIAGQIRDIAFALRVSQIRHEAAGANSRIDLIGHRKDHVLKRQSLAASAILSRRAAALTELIQEIEKQPLFIRLRSVVGGPRGLSVSLASDFDRLGGCGLAVLGNSGLGSFNGDLNGEDVFARPASELVISAGAIRNIGADFILTFARLRGNKPEITGTNYICSLGYLLPFLLAYIHCVLSFLGLHTAEAYNIGCLGRIASAVWLNAKREVDASLLAAKLAAGIRFGRMKDVLASLPVFKTGAFDHSASPPLIQFQRTSLLNARIKNLPIHNSCFGFTISLKSLQYSVNTCQNVFVFLDIEASKFKRNSHVNGREVAIAGFGQQYISYCVRKSNIILSTSFRKQVRVFFCRLCIKEVSDTQDPPLHLSDFKFQVVKLTLQIFVLFHQLRKLLNGRFIAFLVNLSAHRRHYTHV